MAPSPTSKESPPSNSQSTPAKRSRGSIACATCRKQKARCEIVQGSAQQSELLTCRRCQNLRIPCSLSHSDATAIRVIKQGNLDETTGFSASGPPLGEDGAPKRFANMAVGSRFRMWHFLTPDRDDPIAWSAPIQAVCTLIKRMHPRRMVVQQTTDTSLRNILTESQIDQLLEIFSSRYDPWLCIQTSHKGCHELLDAVRCCVASRHLPAPLRASVSGRLQALVQNWLSIYIFNPDDEMSAAIEIIQALIILGTWSYVKEEAEGGISETRVILSSAVGLAMDLRVHQLSGFGDKAKENPELRAKTTLWICLSIMESLSCIGKGRLPVCRRSPLDTTFFEPKPSESITSARETRLGILARVLDLTEHGTCLKFNPEQGGLATVHKNLSTILSKFDSILESISSLSAITEFEKPHCNILKVLCLSSKVVVVYHAIFEGEILQFVHLLCADFRPVRYGYKDIARLPQRALEVGGQHVIQEYGLMGYKSAEQMLTTLVECDTELLGTAPDFLFPHILFICSMVVGIQNFHMIHRARGLPGFSNHLISKGAEKLYACAPTKDHPAVKCANMMITIADAWVSFTENNTLEEQTQKDFVVPLPGNYAYSPNLSSTSSSSSPSSSSDPASYSTTNPNDMFDPFSFAASSSASPLPLGSLPFDPQSLPNIGANLAESSMFAPPLAAGSDTGVATPPSTLGLSDDSAEGLNQFQMQTPFDSQTFAMLDQMMLGSGNAQPQMLQPPQQPQSIPPQGPEDFWWTLHGMSNPSNRPT